MSAVEGPDTLGQPLQEVFYGIHEQIKRVALSRSVNSKRGVHGRCAPDRVGNRRDTVFERLFFHSSLFIVRRIDFFLSLLNQTRGDDVLLDYTIPLTYYGRIMQGESPR